jgi:hypothetical protein
MERLLSQATHEPAAYLANRVSTFLLVNLINQAKDAVEQGGPAQIFSEPDGYIRVSEINKVDAITDRMLELIIYKALPEIQPDMEALLRHGLKESLQNSDVYQGIQRIPGFKTLPVEVTENLAEYLAQASYDIIEASYADAEGRKLLDQLSQRFKHALNQELQNQETLSELQVLLSDFLEEFKINYIQKNAKQDPEEILEEADQLFFELNEQGDERAEGERRKKEEGMKSAQDD